ncbi:Histidine-containing phosphotransfer protein 1 [Spatholobus suberectus]|nr:Histidine-containing phosphotransfer protein 1 [Spatholobus suberectus]
MTMPILKGLLQGYMKSLFEEGVVNDQFNVIMSLKHIGEPDCAVQLIETYFADVEKILSELSHHV